MIDPMKNKDRSAARLRIGLIVAGGFSATLGFVVLVGWHIHSMALVQIRPTLVPMQANTAAGLMLGGFMLLALAKTLTRTSIVLGSIVLAIGIFTLAQYAFDVDFGIDQLLMTHYVTVQTSHPGRMAPNTALSFSLIGIAVLLSEGVWRRWGALINGTFGSLVVGLGIAAALGYVLELEVAYGWGRLTRMAAHTSAGFIVLGVGLFAFAWQTERAERAGLPRWFPIPVAVGVLTITFSMWQALHPDQSSAALHTRHDLVLIFGTALAAALAWAVNKAASERAGKNLLEIEVAERKRAEAELHRVNDRLRVSIERLPVAYIVWDSAFKVTEWNPAAEKTFGFTRDEMLGKSPLDTIVPKDDRPIVAETIKHLLDGKDAMRSMRGNNLRKDGETISCLWFNTPLTDSDGASLGALSTAIDVTEHERIEGQLRQAQKLEAIGLLTGGIAHDFNNLMAIMIGHAELLEDEVGEDAEEKKHIEAIKTAVDRGSSLTRQLLAFSRQQLLSPVATEVSELIGGLHDMLQRTLGETIELQVETAPNLWLARIDPHQLENAVVNLAINARDAMPRGGTLVIETSNAILDATYAEQHEEVKPGDYVTVAVSDTGTGMSPEALEKAFEPFFTTKEMGKGSGLGLSMVFGFVKQSEGHITIYSEIDHGTTVKIYMPRCQANAADTVAEDDATEISRGSERILVVEDDPKVRQIPVTILRGHGYKIVEAGNAKEAIKHLKAGRTFDLLFTDVVLPGGMNGVDIAREAIRLQPGIKVLYTTGYTENAVVHNGTLDPGVTVVNKPYRRAELLVKVRKMLDGKDD